MSAINSRLARRMAEAGLAGGGTAFKFEAIKRAKAAAVAANPGLSLLDFGVGEPDIPADRAVVSVLGAEAGLSENRRYADNGIEAFREAAARWMGDVFGVRLESPGTSLVHGIGSKPILAGLPLAFVDPGDAVLATVPGYPILATHAKFLGGVPYGLPLLKENGFVPDLDSVPDEVVRKAKLLYLNYVITSYSIHYTKLYELRGGRVHGMARLEHGQQGVAEGFVGGLSPGIRNNFV